MNERVQRLLLLVKCLIHIFKFGLANKKVENPQKIIIFQRAKMGDMVCTTPMFRAIKKKYPNSLLTIVGDSVNQQLLVGNLDVDNYIVWDKQITSSFIDNLKKEKYDFGCTAGPNFEALAVLFLARVCLIVTPKVENGWSPYETIPYKILRMFAVIKSHSMGQYAPREYLRLLEPIDIFTDDTKKYLYFSKQAEDEIEKIFIKNLITDKDFLVGISPSAGNKIKKWPEDRFAQIADSIIQKYQAKIIIIGGKNDLEESEEMFANMENKNETLDVTGQLSIDELKALISKLNLFVAVDTGPVYISEAFDVPTIDIVGAMDKNEQPPVGLKHRVVVPVPINPQLHIMNSRIYDHQEAVRQIESITPAMVITEVDFLLKKII